MSDKQKNVNPAGMSGITMTRARIALLDALDGIDETTIFELVKFLNGLKKDMQKHPVYLPL